MLIFILASAYLVLNDLLILSQNKGGIDLFLFCLLPLLNRYIKMF